MQALIERLAVTIAIVDELLAGKNEVGRQV
jgi:hypothetical protein